MAQAGRDESAAGPEFSGPDSLGAGLDVDPDSFEVPREQPEEAVGVPLELLFDRRQAPAPRAVSAPADWFGEPVVGPAPETRRSGGGLPGEEGSAAGADPVHLRDAVRAPVGLVVDDVVDDDDETWEDLGVDGSESADRSVRTRQPLPRAARVLLVAVGVTLGSIGTMAALRAHVATVSRTPTASMEPTIERGQRFLVLRSDGVFGDGPGRGDIIVFPAPPGSTDAGMHLVKRIVGLPGDIIEADATGVRVNDRRLVEPYVHGTTEIPRRLVPAGSVFVLGDNRENSADSRSFGPVPIESIYGRVDRLLSASAPLRRL